MVVDASHSQALFLVLFLRAPAHFCARARTRARLGFPPADGEDCPPPREGLLCLLAASRDLLASRLHSFSNCSSGMATVHPQNECLRGTHQSVGCVIRLLGMHLQLPAAHINLGHRLDVTEAPKLPIGAECCQVLPSTEDLTRTLTGFGSTLGSGLLRTYPEALDPIEQDVSKPLARGIGAMIRHPKCSHHGDDGAEQRTQEGGEIRPWRFRTDPDAGCQAHHDACAVERNDRSVLGKLLEHGRLRSIPRSMVQRFAPAVQPGPIPCAPEASEECACLRGEPNRAHGKSG